MQPNPALIALLTTLLIVLRGWVAAMELASLAPGNPQDAEKRQGLQAAIHTAERLLAAIEAQRGACPDPATMRRAAASAVSLPRTARTCCRSTLLARPHPRKPTALATILASIRNAIPTRGTGPPPHPA